MIELYSVRNTAPFATIQIPEEAPIEDVAEIIPRTGRCDGERCGRDRHCREKASSPGYCMADFKEGGRRRGGDVIGTSWLVLDVDGEDVPPEVAPFERIEIRSHSGGWHILLRLDRPVNAAEYRALMVPWVGAGADGNAVDITRFLFAPVAEPIAYFGERHPTVVAPEEAPAPEAPPPPPPPPPQGPSTIKARPSQRMLDSWVNAFLNGAGVRNELAGAMGGWLGRNGYSAADVAAYVHGALRWAPDAQRSKAVHDAQRAAETARVGGRIYGEPTLEKLGVVVEAEGSTDWAAEGEALAALLAQPPSADDHFDPTSVLGGTLIATSAGAVEPPWLVPGMGIGPGAYTLISGAPGQGKTLLALDLARAVATGGSFLGEHPVARPGRVLFIDHEAGRFSTTRRRQLLQIPDRAVDIVTLPAWSFGTQEGPTALARAAQYYTLIVIDNLRATLPEQDENSSDIRNWFKRLNQISELTGVTLVVIHHNAKGSNRDTAEAAAGSRDIVAACQLHINIQRQPVSRDGSRPPPLLSIEKVRDWPSAWTGIPYLEAVPLIIAPPRLSVGTTDDVERQLEGRALAALRRSGGSFPSLRQFIAAVGGSRGRAEEAIARLVGQGRIAVDRGVGANNQRQHAYRIVEQTQPSPDAHF